MPKLLTEREMCEYLKVGRMFLFHCRQKGMPCIIVGQKFIRYEVEEVIEWMKKQEEWKAVGA